MRSYSEALTWAKAQSVNPSRDYTNLCQLFARSCVGAAAWAPSARLAFNAVPQANRHQGIPPLGALVYYGDAHAGNGHATFSAGSGYVYSTDIKRRGKVDKVPYLQPVKSWGLPYRGWIDLTPSGPIDIFRPVGGGGTGVPVPPPEPVVTMHDLISGASSNGAALINHALFAEGFLAKSLIRDHVGVAAATAFRVYRWRKGFGKDSAAALRALGKRHGFTVA